MYTLDFCDASDEEILGRVRAGGRAGGAAADGGCRAAPGDPDGGRSAGAF